jgi:HSP20 family protein
MSRMSSLIPWRRRRDAEEDLPAFRPLGTLWQDMDRLLDRAWGDEFWPARRSWMPPLDVEETENEVVVRAELPGVNPDDLDVSVSEDALTIAGEKKEEKEHKGRGYFRSECRYGSFRRTIPLPRGVDPDSIQAEYNNGILAVHLKKDVRAQPKRIPVKAGQAALEHKEAGSK